MRKLFLILLTILSVALLCFTAGCDSSPAPSESDTEQNKPYLFKTSELKNYVIVYDGDNPDYRKLANSLRSHLSAKYGKMSGIKRDTDLEPSKYEILLGDTDRCDGCGRIMEYSVTVEGGKFRINVGGSYSAEQAIKYLCESVFDGKELVLEEGEYYKRSLLSDPIPVTESSSARIMSANLLADAFADPSHKKASYRAELFAATLLRYTPDVIALQEVDESWSKMLDLYIQKLEKAHGICYSRHLATYEGKVNYTSLLYRSDKFTVSDSGVEVFDWWTNASFKHGYHMRNVSWAKFTPKKDGEKEFIVADTHWSYRTEHADGRTFLAPSTTPIATNELRLQCKDETKSIMSELNSKHKDVPIFLCGDFNSSLTFFTKGGWTPDGFGIISEIAGENGTAQSTVAESGHFDHIFGNGSFDVKRFESVSTPDLHGLLSDHPFVYTDVDLRS